MSFLILRAVSQALGGGGGGGGTDVLSNPVTTALAATGTGTRYDVTTDAQMRAVPWGSLTAGSVVNIFWKASPYLTKIALRAQGTSTNPVRVWGVTDASGNRPALNGNNAVTASGCNPSGGYSGANDIFTNTAIYGEGLGIIVLKRGPQDAYGTYEPKWIIISNLEVYGTYNGTGFNNYTDLSGATSSFSAAGNGIHFQCSEDSSIENCVIHDSANGIFGMSKDDLLSESNLRMTVHNSRVYGNGTNGSFYEHGFYVQGASTLVEGCYIGQNRTGSGGSSFKSRCSDDVFRYNHVVASARAMDFVHAEDQLNGVQAQPNYGLTRCYGNVIENNAANPLGMADEAVHFGGDNLGEDDPTDSIGTTGVPPMKDYGSRYRTHLWFYNNTYVTRGTDGSNPYRTNFFGLSTSNINPNSPEQVVEAWNNIHVIASAGALPTEPSWVEWCGTVNLLGNNVAYGGTILDSRSDATSSWLAINKTGTLITTNPNLNSLTTGDYSLQTGSSAIGQATTPASMASIVAANPINFQPRFRTNGLVSRPTVNDLGALEHGIS